MKKFVPSRPMVVSCIALAFAVGGGTAGAAVSGALHIGTDQIKTGAVRARNIHPHSVGPSKLTPYVDSQLAKNATTTTVVQPTTTTVEEHTATTNTPVPGAKGDTGATGATGARGPQGEPGDSYFEGAYYAVAHYDSGDTNGGAIATVACQNQSDTAISGGVSTDDYTKTVPVGESFPGRMDWTTNTPMPNRLDGWIVQFASQSGSAPMKVKVWALCVPNLNLPVVTTYDENGGS